MAWKHLAPTPKGETEPTTANAFVGPMDVVVAEKGELESSRTEVGICEVQGTQIKIIFLTPEGNKVQKDEVVCRLDSSEIERNLTKQEIEVRQAKSKVETAEQELAITKSTVENEVAEAEVEWELAKLDVTKYILGEYLVSQNDFMGQIALAEVELEKAKSLNDQMKQLVKKGFKTPEQLRASEQSVAQTQNYLDRDKQKLEVLRTYDSKRKTTELQSKARQAKSKVDRTKANALAKIAKSKSELDASISTHDMQNDMLRFYKEQKEKCVIKATQPGVVAYANRPWYDVSRQIREGANVHTQQAIFTLPDMSKLQVKLNIHEAMIKMVKVGQPVEIRADANPKALVHGTVESVSLLADSSDSWGSADIKRYRAVVAIKELPGQDFKPGMTVEARIKVKEIADALQTPIAAVTEQKTATFVYVKEGNGFSRKTVEIGENNDTHVQILSGVKDGDVVALDARRRAVREFSQGNAKAKSPLKQSPPTSPTRRRE